MATKKTSPATKTGKTVKPALKKVNKPTVLKKNVIANKKSPAKPASKKASPLKHSKIVSKKNPLKKVHAPAPSSKGNAVKKGLKPLIKSKSTIKKPEALKPVHKIMTKKTDEKKVAPKLPNLKEAVKNQKAKDEKLKGPAKMVVLPKINTKTSRKYQPDFTKSVLDIPVNNPGAPIVRYSDSDLTEFRDLIQRKLDSAKKELAYLQGLITRKDDMGGDETDNRYMTMEDGSLSMEREQLSQMASRQITFIDHLEKALMRIENKTYGICRVTGRLIDKARLRAVPHATLSIEAKMGMVK